MQKMAICLKANIASLVQLHPCVRTYDLMPVRVKEQLKEHGTNKKGSHRLIDLWLCAFAPGCARVFVGPFFSCGYVPYLCFSMRLPLAALLLAFVCYAPATHMHFSISVPDYMLGVKGKVWTMHP